MFVLSTMVCDITIRPLVAEDWSQVSRIYRQGIATGNATFERVVPMWEEWDAAHLAVARLVAVDDQKILGWVALSPVSRRAVYAGVAEFSVYVAEHSRGAGIGRKLLESLIEAAEAAGIWTLQSSVFPENTASLRLCEVCGFRKVGVRARIGQMDGRWRDTVLIERRSALVGR